MFFESEKISPDIALRHAMELEKTTAKYPIKRVIVNSYIVNPSASKACLVNIHMGNLPNRVVVGFVNTADMDGSLKSNPFNFKHFDIRMIKLRLSQLGLPYIDGLKMDFDKDRYHQAYNTLFQGLNEFPKDISYSDYKNGYTLFVFDLTPDLCSAEHFNLLRVGQLDLDIECSKPIPKDISAIIYFEFDNVLEIDKNRKIIKDYNVASSLDSTV